MKFLSFLALSFFIFTSVHAENSDVLTTKLRAIADQHHSEVAVTAIHIESNQKVTINGSTPFFMASTVKLPIAITLLRRVDQQKESLDRLVCLKISNAVPGSGRLYSDLNLDPHRESLSVDELLQLMLTVSDNTASDALLHAVRGPNAVTHQMHRFGFHHILINRSIYDMYLACSGFPKYHQDLHDNDKFQQELAELNLDKKVAAWKKFQIDPRDTATSNDMALLLSKLYQNKLLSAKSTQHLLDIMTQCQTGKHRIKGMLPETVAVAHKTGSWSIDNENLIHYPASHSLYRYAHDVGIITLPEDKGHIAIAIFVKSKTVEDQSRNETIAAMTKAIYNHFLQSA